MTPLPAPPPLTWAERPRHLACAAPGCARTPLCGYLSDDRKTFYCAACWNDGWESLPTGNGKAVTPRLRTAEERERILRGSP